MAKMFYSLDEAAQKLGKSAAEVRDMAASGQLQEFRDRDKLMFKREQVDLLAGDSVKGGSGVGLADSAGNSGIGLALEDSSGGSGAIELDDPAPAAKGGGKSANDRSGISIFDTESTEEGDPSAVTRITETNAGGDLTLDNVGSGSGLLDLTRESDDTSLGADLLEDVYKPDDAGAETQGASGLFEQTSAPSDVGAASPGFAGVAMIAAEPYDAPWSGIAGGVALGVLLITGLALVVTLLGLMGADGGLITMIGASLWMFVGIFAGVLIILAIVGWLLGKRG
jgi:hypothetical protein